MSTANGALATADPSTEAATRIYRGRSLDELISRIEAELGADAIVVRRERGLEGGIGGFFQRPFVEIEARPGTPRIDVYDEDAPAMPALTVAGAEAERSAPQRAARPLPQRPLGAYLTGTLADLAAPQASSAHHTPPVEDPPAPQSDPAPEFRELTPDTFGAALVAAERAAIDTLPAVHDLRPPAVHDLRPPAVHDLRPEPPRASASTSAVAVPGARARARIQDGLMSLGISEELAGELIDGAAAHVLPLHPRMSLARAVHSALVQRIPVARPLPAASATIAVVGPGGSGKTSCCAALLGAYRRGSTLPASCATILLDPEHGTPAMLLSPHIMAPTAIAAPYASQALAAAREDGLLLLDLPPLSPADRGAVRTVAGLLGRLDPQRVIVALPATLGAKAAAQLLTALRPLGADAVAITHADETDQIGVAVEAACHFGLAPEYLLDRGRARGGLTRVDPRNLADRLLPQ